MLLRPELDHTKPKRQWLLTYAGTSFFYIRSDFQTKSSNCWAVTIMPTVHDDTLMYGHMICCLYGLSFLS